LLVLVDVRLAHEVPRQCNSGRSLQSTEQSSEHRSAMPRFPLFALPICLLLSVAACTEKQNQPKSAQAPASVVTTAIVNPAPWVDTIEALGTAKARESITLTAKITETVRRINFEDGQQVSAGDVLVELTSGQQVAALAEAQATYKDAERLMTRNLDLVRQGTVSRQVADTAKATHDSSKARVDLLRAQLSDRVVTAPFSGVLGLRQISVGALVTPGTVITTLDDIDAIKLDFAIPESMLAAVRPGHEVVGRSAAFPGREFHGKVLSLDSRVDPVTRAVQVRAEFPNKDHALRAGMLISAQVLREPRDALSVPEIAVVQVGNKSHVYRVKGDDTVEEVVVKLGARRRGEVEIVEGLAAGDRIVIDGTVKLRNGARINDAAKTASDAP
jgi:membrane fusion protein (multidrug efflux system)